MDVLEERKYLKNVVLKQVDKFIEKTKEEQEFYRSEVENMGIPDLEQRGYFKRCKEKVFTCEEKINKLKKFRENTHFGRMDLELIEDGNKENNQATNLEWCTNTENQRHRIDVLGKDTLNVILDNPDNLLLIPGITKKNIDTLHVTLEEYQASYKIILVLNDLGFVTRDSMVIYNKYKNRTLDVIDSNFEQE